MRFARAGISGLLAPMIVAGCSGFGAMKPAAEPDPNTFPADYKTQIVTLVSTTLDDRADFRGALISTPALKPVGQNQHYVVCLQFNGRSQRKSKVVIFLAGAPNEFIDSTPELCADAAYQPFKELEEALPEK